MRQFGCGCDACIHNQHGQCMAGCILIDEKTAACRTYRRRKHLDMEVSVPLVPRDARVICGKTACVHNARCHCMAEVFCVEDGGKKPACASFLQI